MTATRRQHSHVARLLEQVLVEGEIEPAALARVLGASAHRLEEYRTGTERMPTAQQLSFAELVLARYPQFARLAHRMAAQAHAESAYQANATQTHLNTPPSRFS